MENFTPKSIDLAGINGGVRYKNGDIPSAEAINAPIEAAAYAQKLAKEANDLVKLATGSGYEEVIAAIKTVVNDEAHPIGSLWFTDANDDPAELFGGSWEKIVDRTIVGAGGKYSIGTTGGSADAVLVKHTHNFKGTGGQIDGYDASVLYRYNTNASYKNPAWNYGSYGTSDGYLSLSQEGTSATGANMMPYKAFYVWHRYG